MVKKPSFTPSAIHSCAAEAAGRRVRALIEFDIVIPEHEKDEREFIEKCFTGTRCKIIEIKKPEPQKGGSTP
jgi:hypothetical protein